MISMIQEQEKNILSRKRKYEIEKKDFKGK